MKDKKIPVASIALYIAAGLMVSYTAWSFINSYKYISDMLSVNQLVVKGNVYNITSFYMSNSGQYLFYAISLFALSYILQKLSMIEVLSPKALGLAKAMETNEENEADDEDFEEWLNKDD